MQLHSARGTLVSAAASPRITDEAAASPSMTVDTLMLGAPAVDPLVSSFSPATLCQEVLMECHSFLPAAIEVEYRCAIRNLQALPAYTRWGIFAGMGIAGKYYGDLQHVWKALYNIDFAEHTVLTCEHNLHNYILQT